MNKKITEAKQRNRLIIGFVVSLFCTFIVYMGVVNKWFSSSGAALFILIIATIQALTQARFFFHLDEEPKPRWQLHTFWFTALMALVIVIGSIWVMMNLNYNMGMSSEQMNEYMLKQNKKGF
jgi:cytochrome o ubiquinol oxidase operon protein cyoD